MRGRKPLPPEVHAQRGNAGKRRHAAAAAATPTDEFTAPRHLPAIASGMWATVVRELTALNMLRSSDLFALEGLCIDYYVYRTALADIEREGTTYETTSKHGNLRRIHPQVAVMNRARVNILRALETLGLSIVSRARIRTWMLAHDRPDPKPGELPLNQPATNDPASPLGFLN